MVKITFFHPTGDEGRQYASEPSQFFEYMLSKLFYTISPMVGSFLKFSCLCPAQWVRRVQKRNFGSWISLDFVVLVNFLGFK